MTRSRALATALLLVLSVAVGGAEQEGATPKLLPVEIEGEGLAAKYAGDRGIAKDPDVVLAEDFEADGLAKRWSEVKRTPGPVAVTEKTDEVHAGKRAVRIDWTPGKDTGGHLYRNLGKGEDRLFLRFYVKFPKGHGYVHHFVHLVGYRPPTDWPQGGAGERPAGDERFSTGLDVYGDWGQIPPPGRWGLYSYWSEMKASGDGKYWGNEPPGGKRIAVATDRWICAEVMVKANSPGKADGEQAFWIDGKCAGRWGGYRWRTTDELRVNGVWLLYYVTEDAVRRSRGEPKEQHVLFDDVVAARRYVGPMKRGE